MSGSTTDAVLSEFFSESDEILQRVSSHLSAIENAALDASGVDELYRDIHTLKGSAQLFGLRQVAYVAHAVETVLDPVRRWHSLPNPKLLDALYKCVSLLDQILLALKAQRKEDEAEIANNIQIILPRLFESACAQFGMNQEMIPDSPAPREEIDIEKKSILSFLSSSSNSALNPESSIPREDLPPIFPVSSEALKSKLDSQSGQDLSSAPKDKDKDDEIQLCKMDRTAEGREETDSTIRVQVGLLDNLMNLVGEVVLVRNQVLQFASRSEDLGFINLSQRLDGVTSDLQDQVMRTRMQPLGNVLGKFQRVIRELAKDLGKRIDLTVQGRDTELDKTLLETIKDPLTHIVRNCCDHGIESISERAALGKPETGHILISAFHESGQVIIEISDDGKGMNRKKIAQRAVELGIVASEAVDRLSDREILNLVCHPGFTTASSVSAVSGRGVGMDVVKTNIEKIGGSVELESIEGRGSTIRLRIPLTLAIVPAMLIKCCGDDYAIPQVKLVELVRVEQRESQIQEAKIEFVQGKPVFHLRGRLLPLVDLRVVLKKGQSSVTEGTVNIVVLHAENGMFGLLVDEVLDTADIVVKPLSKFLKTLEVFSAATILGSGKVALILDPMGIAKVMSLAIEKKQGDVDFLSPVGEADAFVDSDVQEFLLFRTLGSGKYAIPLCMVNRLEEFRVSDIEYSGDRRVMQYRSAILPLIDINQTLKFGDHFSENVQSIPTIVVQKSGHSYGLVVEEILDVCVIENTVDDLVRDRFGLMGNVIYKTDVINVIDALAIVDAQSQSVANTKDQTSGLDVQMGQRHRILFAEDVSFFRRQVTKLLGENGFEVVAVENGQRAIEVFKKAGPKYFSMIVSDIEMPQMTGLELARAVRAISQSIPMIALTTRFRQRDIDDGKSAGFDRYLEKLNPEVLLANMREMLISSGSIEETIVRSAG